jgi:hypothetical protein
LAVPRSTAISFAGSQDITFHEGNFIRWPLRAWLSR